MLEKIKEWHDLSKGNQSIDSFCNENNITLDREEKTKLLKSLVKKDIFYYSTFLGNSISLIADTDKKFLNLLKTIILTTKGDLAIGWFEMALIKTGKENHDLGISLSKKMQQIKDVKEFSAAPLGGVGYVKYSKIKKIVNDMLTSSDLDKIVQGIRTIRISFHNKRIKDEHEIFSKIEAILANNNEKINREVVAFLLECYEENPKFAQKHLMNFAKADDMYKTMITRHLWLHPIKNDKNALMLIEECHNSKDKNVQQGIYYALANYTKTQYEKIMNIIREAFENQALPYGTLEHLIQSLGKNSLKETLIELEKWLNIDNFHLKFSIPRFIKILIPVGRKQECFFMFEKWAETIPRDLFLKIYKSILASCYKNESDQNFVKNSKKLLSKMASNIGLEPNLFIKNESDETLQCASLVKGLEYYSEDLDYGKICNNIKLFPNLEKILTVRWIMRKKEQNNRTNLLLRVLERELPNEKKIQEIIKKLEHSENIREFEWNKLRLENHVYDFFYLLNIEKNLQNLKEKRINIIKHFRNKLQNDEQTDDAISEINLTGNLAKYYDLVLEASVGTRNIDSLIGIDGQKVYLEIINPSEFLLLDLFEGEVFTIPNRIKNKILDKCEYQLSQVPDDDIPVILGIDIQGSDIDELSITDALYGSTQYTFLMDKKTGEERGGFSSLKDNSIHKSKAESDILSAVLYFKSELLNDFKFHITGRLIHNPNAKNHLIHHITKRIEEIMIQQERNY